MNLSTRNGEKLLNMKSGNEMKLLIIHLHFANGNAINFHREAKGEKQSNCEKKGESFPFKFI